MRRTNRPAKLAHFLLGRYVHIHSMASSNMAEEQQLFGGAMVASIPTAWRNVSLVRQVPGEEFFVDDNIDKMIP